jgi:lipooligosaccharide transport system permease protein
MRKSLPTSWSQVLNVWHRNFLLFKRSWSISVFWILVEPVVILGSIGYGVGSYINNVNGVPYVTFYFPALLASTSMLVAFFESTYGNF